MNNFSISALLTKIKISEREESVVVKAINSLKDNQEK